ncbi:hypothetical protein AAG570_006319 [Ranatra chinensis]|uniref:Uncharacterized protein n=1 Tax=Ranatra chinensis TaxID=642074 RepID=A0ABD0ZAQ1_9HEMI
MLQVINFDSPRGGVSLVTEKGSVTTSRLLIQKAIPTDSGIYTCDPSNANTATIRVHILNGERLCTAHTTNSRPVEFGAKLTRFGLRDEDNHTFGTPEAVRMLKVWRFKTGEGHENRDDKN